MLRHHVVEHWSDAWLSKFRIGHTNDCVETCSEDAMLRLNVAKLLAFDDQSMLAFSYSEVISEKVAAEVTGAKLNLGCLRRPYCSQACCVVVTTVVPRYFLV